MADEMGLENVLEVLRSLQEETDSPRYEPAETIVELAESGGGFYD
jgi:hypothetical protein